MPFHRYECESCGEQFRILHRDAFGIEDGAVCPHCGSLRARRLLPRVGVIYKGSGYYSTDYRGKRPVIAKPTKNSEEKIEKSGGSEATAGKTEADRSES